MEVVFIILGAVIATVVGVASYSQSNYTEPTKVTETKSVQTNPAYKPVYDDTVIVVQEHKTRQNHNPPAQSYNSSGRNKANKPKLQ